MSVTSEGCSTTGGRNAHETAQASGTTTPSTTAAPDEMTPVQGGTITVSTFAAGTGFDPANVTVAGSTNGMELTALYGTLLRYNAETAEYEGQMAKGFSSNADFTQFTLTLRDGIKFIDGTDYDAAAVKLNIERHMEPTAKSSAKAALLQFVDSIETPDTKTVVINLKKGWAGFPFMLTLGAGMVLSPAAIEKAGDNLISEPGDAGAGAFKIESYNAGEALVLVPNPDYFDGAAYIDELKFIQAGAPDKSYIALQNDTVQAAFLRDPIALASAEKDGFPNLLISSPGGNIALFNSGAEATCNKGLPATYCAGKDDGTKVLTTPPTADPRIRLAVSYAIDRDAMNDRVWQGTAITGAQLLDESSQFYSDVTFPDYDPEAAKTLVAEAKADGWDGSVRVLADSSNADWGLTIKTLLEAVGFTVDLDTSKPISGIIPQVAAQKDYDIVSWSTGMDESDGDYFFTTGNFGTGGRYGYSGTEFDAALDEMRVASNLDEKIDAYKALSEAWADGMPAAIIATVIQGLVYSEEVHGLKKTSGGIVYFDKAFLSK